MKVCFPVVLGLAAGLAAAPMPAAAMDLTDALIEAYSSNPTLLGQRAKLRSTDEEMPKALSGWRPTVTASGEVGPSVRQSNTPSTNTNFSQRRDVVALDLTMVQPLFTGFRTVAATSEAENTIRAERARLEAVEQTVLLRAATSYVDVVRDQAVLDLNIGNEQVLDRQLEAIGDRFRVGEVTRTDVSQAEARKARATANRVQAAGNLERSRAAFLNAVGVAVPGRLAPATAVPDLELTYDAVLKTALQSHPDVIAARYDEAAREDTIDGVRGELLPRLNLEATAARDLQASSEKSRLNTVEGFLVLTIPLYESGSVRSRLRQAKQNAAQTRLRTDQVQRDSTERATQSWEALQTARASIKAFQTQISSSEIALEGVQRENSVGSRTVLDVLDAEQELLDAKVNMVRAQRDELVAVFQLKLAVGALSARNLRLPVDYYDPNAHYDEVEGMWFSTGASGETPDAGRKPAAGSNR